MKGFTFSQLAVIILVVLGLTVAVVIAATQFSRAGSSLTEIGSKTDTGSVDISLGLKCLSSGGVCITGTSSDACTGNYEELPAPFDYSTDDDCSSNTSRTKVCCKPK